jgi:hypothetical protein
MIESTRLEVAHNHRLVFISNRAKQDGGGLMLADGGQVVVIDEACPLSMCDAASRGNGICDLNCMTRGCNWLVTVLKYLPAITVIRVTSLAYRDDGDCGTIFLQAGDDALRPCDRSACTTFQSDYDTNAAQCTSKCFNASCDWSRALCASQRAVLATCPLFDGVTLASVRYRQKRQQLLYSMGGSARCRPDNSAPDL